MKINIMPFQRFHTGAYGEVNHDKAIADKIAENFMRKVTGYPIPLLVSHSETQGKLGEITSVTSEEDGLYADVNINDKGKKILDSSQFDFVSPAYAEQYKDKMTGADVGATLLEVSLTNKPGQPNMERLRFEEAAKQIKIKNYERSNKMEENKVIKMYEEQIDEQKAEVKKLTDEMATQKKTFEEQVKTLTDEVKEKDATIKELTDKVQAVEKAKFESEIESWAKDWGSKGKAPAIVNQFKDKVLAGEVTKAFADDILKEVPAITKEGTEQPVNMTENYDKIAKTMAEM
jgi:phage I-like protein